MELFIRFLIRGVQEPKYKGRLLQELAFSNRSWTRTRSGYFLSDHEPEQERFLAECF